MMISSGDRALELEGLSNGLPGITPSYGKVLAESGAVCFDSQGHRNGVYLRVNGDLEGNFQVFWSPVTEQSRRCHNDQEVATENGAYGVAFLVIKDLTEFTVIERSKKGTGFDYWLGREGGDSLFQDKARLEVSGIRSGNKSKVSSRVNKKMRQTEKSDGCLPAFIVVVEFGRPIAEVRNK